MPMTTKKFSFIANTGDLDHLYDGVKWFKPTLPLSKEAVKKIIEWTPSFKGTDIPVFVSAFFPSL